ncbi:MAG: glycerol kinase GlpK [Candidatus Marinimicrobia bacterium]|jgi:glycerol kinase|nr:glycerol kinase GlpK [Candidatus Neomarinimicrobiota bacterium]MBT3631702.1 glycerol kinase GlpK [Candidatus Neomarinimicrobiota bacterium]MBT3825903.1 glycerol kinase GlpK [Candidatus Neomarinimicrobiota bacterium]MBT4130000.1 glycerol kinase GlpK [Candidatus Neomarinimicrobiota bacterium]MBT4296014.1 glycerol kinase GlpK [Candidatus Neomarinimicrobiota bacterium]
MAILSIDQGTTGTTVILVGSEGQVLAKTYHEFQQFYPQRGWVEHDPEEIWETVVECVGEICSSQSEPIEAIGITNQRETTIIWDADTGIPVYNAIVWQCRRTASICETLEPHRSLIKAKTGLPLDAYFSGTKAQWILNHASIRPEQNLKFGTIDTWLIWKLTGGKVHATDYSNASRTMLFNIHNRVWDTELCQLLDVPEDILPEVKNSADDYGVVSALSELDGIPIRGVAGDQQASLFGQQCFQKGETKNTYGTGCFIMMNTGSDAVKSEYGLITTLAADPDGKPCYALEGSIFIAGAAIQWLRDELGLLKTAADSEAAALSVPDNDGVYLVPAFTGLGAPHWNMEARGLLTGLTRGSNKNHIIRASLEAMAYQTYDVIQTLQKETGAKITSLAVDGGASENKFLMQFQADMLQIEVQRVQYVETTALGVAYLAGLGIGIWNKNKLKSFASHKTIFAPGITNQQRDSMIVGWNRAIKQALTK